MARPSDGSATTRVSRCVHARRNDVYAAFVDPEMLAVWLPPRGMRGVVHTFEPRDGGRIRMSLTYDDPAQGPGGKTTQDTDTFSGRFAELRPGRRVVWVVAFDSGRPGMSGEMRVIWELNDSEGATEVTVTCVDIPPGIRPEDNEAGSASSLANLARLLEGRT